MVKIKSFKLIVCLTTSALFPMSATASSFWQSSSGSPIKSANGACVVASFAKHELAACQPSERVILLPGANGKAGAVLISTKGATHRLDQAYKTVSSSQGNLSENAVSAGEVSNEFGQLLNALPQPITAFTVKFVSGSATQLTADSATVMTQLLAEIENRAAPEIRLVGHTDSVGELLKNDILSKERAQTVVGFLIEQGIKPDSIEATGRGEREPAVVTADNVNEAANRRVDIRVR